MAARGLYACERGQLIMLQVSPTEDDKYEAVIHVLYRQYSGSKGRGDPLVCNGYRLFHMAGGLMI